MSANDEIEPDEHGNVTLLWHNGFRAKIRWPGTGPRPGKRRESRAQAQRWQKRQHRNRKLMVAWLNKLARDDWMREIVETMEEMVRKGDAVLVGRDANGDPIIKSSIKSQLAARREAMRQGPN